VIQQLNEIRWALARLFFIGYIGFSVVSLVGGFLTAPLMTWYFFGDWRFWRHWSQGVGLLPHAWRLLRQMRRDNQAYMFSVPLTSPPRTTPDLQESELQLHRFWPHGSSCGDCSNCCRAGGYACPLLDKESELCSGYNSFYWRYFNCGRFPSVASEIDYYGCRKWVLPQTEPAAVQPVMVSLSALTDELRDIRFGSSLADTSQTREPDADDPMPDGEVVEIIGRQEQSKLRGSTTAWRSDEAERRYR
jgi:hypothetical protein